MSTLVLRAANKGFHLPKLRRVHVSGGVLRGVRLLGKLVQVQNELEQAYQTAVSAVTSDRRPALKEDPEFRAVGPLEQFAELKSTERAAIDFTRRFGPLLSQTPGRLRSRPPRTRERTRGVSGRAGGIIDRLEWSIPLELFWLEQRKFRLLCQLGVAATSSPDTLPELLREAVEIFEDFRTLGETTSDALDRMSQQDSFYGSRERALRWIDEMRTSERGRHQLENRAGELTAAVLNRECPKPVVSFDIDNGFRNLPACQSLKDVLYFLLAHELPRFSFCKNCGSIYRRTRPDKNTCGQRCASLFGKREWARHHRNRGRPISANSLKQATRAT